MTSDVLGALLDRIATMVTLLDQRGECGDARELLSECGHSISDGSTRECVNCHVPLPQGDASCRECYDNLLAHMGQMNDELAGLRALVPDDDRLTGKTLTECVAALVADYEARKGDALLIEKAIRDLAAGAIEVRQARNEVLRADTDARRAGAYAQRSRELLQALREAMASYETDFDATRLEFIAQIDALLAKNPIFVAVDKGAPGGDKTVEVHSHMEGDSLVIDKMVERDEPVTEHIQHASDCAIHNMPAYPNGPCDCGAAAGHSSFNVTKGETK